MPRATEPWLPVPPAPPKRDLLRLLSQPPATQTGHCHIAGASIGCGFGLTSFKDAPRCATSSPRGMPVPSAASSLLSATLARPRAPESRGWTRNKHRRHHRYRLHMADPAKNVCIVRAVGAGVVGQDGMPREGARGERLRDATARTLDYRLVLRKE